MLNLKMKILLILSVLHFFGLSNSLSADLIRAVTGDETYKLERPVLTSTKFP